MSNTGQGSAGNVLAAFASLFIPGLGQLLQGRWFTALIHICLAGLIWFISFGTLGWIVHIISCLGAARWDPNR